MSVKDLLTYLLEHNDMEKVSMCHR